ncbi:MAG: hypothetical protein EB147_09380 [Acidimicrobiia bacterium]|nr:hypothetical protein [Acidimicrobiia bacterium]
MRLLVESTRTDPAPASEPTVSLLFTSRVAPEATLTAVESESRSEEPDKEIVPAEIVVAPV